MFLATMRTILPNLLGQLLKVTTAFRGKQRLIQYWMTKRDKDTKKIRVLPGGGRVLCDLSVPYEAMVWLKHEEQKDLEVLRRLLKPNQTFVDCGANIGIWSIVAASTVGIDGEVYAFEPNPSTYAKLSYNISQQSRSGRNINCFNMAVGNANARLPFECNEFHNISQIVTETNNQCIEVPVVMLSSTISDKYISGIKIDVEGFELEVLQGAEAILKNSKPWLCVEFNTLLAKVNTLSDWNVHQYLIKIGYVCRQFYNALDDSPETILSADWQTTGYCNLYYKMKCHV